MKRLVFAAALFFAASAFADTVQSANIFGVLKIDGTSTANLAVCVPWVAAGTGEAVNVNDLVMAFNRETGDVLYYYDATAKNFKAWELQNGVWTAVSSVSSSPSGVTIGETAASQTAARGGALIVHRENSASLAKPIYLYGQYSSDAATTAVAQGTAAAPVISLIAPPSTAAAGYDMNAEGHAIVSTGTSIGLNDYIMLSGSSVRYQYKEGAGWGVYGGDEWNSATSQWTRSFTAGLVIPAGRGALYVSKGGNPTFTW